MSVRLTNIQHFSLDDGPGIRTTIFLKGCNLNCPWCCNPEAISSKIEKYSDDNGLVGFDMELKDLEDEILADKVFYDDNGGLTLSGGEPLLQIKQIEPLLKSLKRQNINICMETALFAPLDYLKIAIKYVDEFYVDIKILRKDKCKEIIKGNLDVYLENLKYLSSLTDKIIFRIPLVNEFTLDNENIKLILDFLEKYSTFNVEIFKVHNLADEKYKNLNRKYKKFSEVDDEKLEEVYGKIKKVNNNVKIIKF
ncbi:MAG: radical SAM protein [Methanobrevibacter sp.]